MLSMDKSDHLVQRFWAAAGLKELNVEAVVYYSSYHGLSQQGVRVPFWTPKPLKRYPQDTQNSCVEFLKISISSLLLNYFISL